LGINFDAILWHILLMRAKNKEHLTIIIIIKKEWKIVKWNSFWFIQIELVAILSKDETLIIHYQIGIYNTF
jgi:hypothetical protein